MGERIKAWKAMARVSYADPTHSQIPDEVSQGEKATGSVLGDSCYREQEHTP